MIAKFTNLRMGTKLLVVFLLVVLLVVGIVGSLGVMNMQSINAILAEITDQRVPSVKNATAVERYALRTIMDEKMYLLYQDTKYQQSAMANIDQIMVSLDAVDKVATQYNDQDLLSKSQEVRTVTEEYKKLYNDGVGKLQNNRAAAKTMDEKGQVVVNEASAYFQAKMKDTSSQAKEALAIVVDIWDTALQTRLHEKNYMLYKDSREFTGLEANITKLNKLYDDLQKVTTAADELQRIDTARAATTAYHTAAQDWVKNDQDLTAVLAQMAEIGTKVQDNAMKAEDAGWNAADASKLEASNVFSQALTYFAIAGVVAVVLGLIVSITFARSVTKPLAQVHQAAQKIAEGDLNQTLEIKSTDEIGQIAASFTQMIAYLQSMAGTATSIADGNLTQTVTPQSTRDVLGNAFAQMITNLHQLVSQVANNATGLGVSAGQLSDIASQAGQAAEQVTQTIQQIATGTTQQTESVNRSQQVVEQVIRAIEGVAHGAQEQATAVGKSATIAAQISSAVDQVAANAQAGAQGAANAATTARQGAAMVEQTLQGMHAIKTKVGLSAQKVQEMGLRSHQIGAIVETIDDIASQTNLLALNAAIEAARAGEHGKGFAVVADEVRKLAEKSATATKEIGGLIKGIQQTVNEAVQAMDEGAKEVEQGVQRANASGAALADILAAAETVTRQAETIAAAAQQMNAASAELVGAMETVSAIVEENTASTEEMAASSGEVSSSIENIASISQENSAATEEVNAAAEEMSAQVEEVTASAHTLSQMAQTLQALVGEFTLTSNTAARPNPIAAIPPAFAAPAPARLANGHKKEPVPTARG